MFAEWTRATDPANVQPKIRPILREIAAHVRRHPPEGVGQEPLEEMLSAIEAPLRPRQERELRATFAQGGAPRARSSAIFDKVRELGLIPYRAPEPLGVIDHDEVTLVCWLAVDTEAGR